MMKNLLVGLAIYGAFSMLGDPRAALVQIFNQQEVITACLVLEAGGEGSAGMQAVMNVIQNRAQGDVGRLYAETTRPQQFSALNNAQGLFFRDFSALVQKAKHDARYAKSWKAAKSLVDKAFHNQLSDLTQGATYYYSTRMKAAPFWANNLRETVTLRGHKFLAAK